MKENEIRPKKIFNKFLKLAKLDVKKYFKKKKKKDKMYCMQSKWKIFI